MAEKPITPSALRRWGPLAISVLAAVASGGAVYATTRGNVAELQGRVSKLEAVRETDHQLLERIDRRVAYIAGQLDEKHGSAAIGDGQ